MPAAYAPANKTIARPRADPKDSRATRLARYCRAVRYAGAHFLLFALLAVSVETVFSELACGSTGTHLHERVHADQDGTLFVGNACEVVLADVLFSERLSGLNEEDAQALNRARTALIRGITVEHTLTAVPLDAEPDRYGRLMIDAVDRSDRTSLRNILVSAGLAVVNPRSASPACCSGLYRAEARARSDRKGMWGLAEPPIPVRLSSNGMAKPVPIGFTIVEGRVASIGKRERILYLNFGRDWKTDFTVTLARSDFDARQLRILESLAGRRIRVRGVADPWQGGRISVTLFSQIEILSP